MLLSPDPESAKIRRRLVKYCEEHLLSGEEFICRYHSICRGSHPEHFFEGQLPHVGKHYSILRNRKPIRIMVVGQEYGGVKDIRVRS